MYNYNFQVTKVRKRSKSVAFEPDESLVAMAAAAPKEPPKKNTKEIYTRLRNLEAGKIYSVYGVVTFFKPPRQTRGEGKKNKQSKLQTFF